MSNAVRMTEEQLEAYLRRQNRKPALAAPVNTSSPPPAAATQAPAKKESELERRFAQQIAATVLPAPVREYYFVKDRDFRLDFAWPEKKVAVEIQGAVHRIRGRFKADLEKRALALLAGWRVLELGRGEIKSEQGIEWLKQLLES